MEIPDEEDDEVMISKPQLIGWSFKFEKIERTLKTQSNGTNSFNQTQNGETNSFNFDVIK